MVNFLPNMHEASLYFNKSALTTLSWISTSSRNKFSTKKQWSPRYSDILQLYHSSNSNMSLRSNRPNIMDYQVFLLPLHQLFLRETCKHTHFFLVNILSHYLHLLALQSKNALSVLDLHSQDVAPSLREQILARSYLHHSKKL